MYKINQGNIFLIDGIGDLLSAGMLYFVVHKNALWFGVLPATSTILAQIACCLATYSIICHLLKRSNWQTPVRILALSNIFYCVITVLMLSKFINQMEWPGFIYFSLELLIILTLSFVEISIAKQ